MIGIFGGSFNPIHLGHLILAQDLISEGRISDVYFMPCLVQPLKPTDDLFPFDKRCKWIKQSIQDKSHLHLLDIEKDLPKPNYTYNTLSELKKQGFPEFCFIMGGDNLSSIKSWYKYRELLTDFPILILMRPGYPVPEDYVRIGNEELLSSRLIDITSTEIRARMRSGKEWGYLMGGEGYKKRLTLDIGY